MKKIQQIIIMLAVLTFAAAGNGAMAQQIELGGWNTGEWNPIFVPKAALDTIKCLTHIPKGYSVESFEISRVESGFFRSARTESSTSVSLSPKQRGILSIATPSDKIYVEKITLINNKTKERLFYGSIALYVVDKPIKKMDLPHYNKFEGAIELGGWNNGKYHYSTIPQSALDTLTCLTHIPEGFRVGNFNMNIITGGIIKETSSESVQLTDKQRDILKSLSSDDRVYIDVNLISNNNDQFATTTTLVFQVVDKPELSKGNHPTTIVDVLPSTKIGFGRFCHLDKIPYFAVDSLVCLTDIPDTYDVINFTVSATIRGFTQEASSKSAAITAQQREIISKVPAGGKIYIENITIKSKITGGIINMGTIMLYKHSSAPEGRTRLGSRCLNDDNNHSCPGIYVYPSLGSKDEDTTHYIVKSFSIRAVNPDYIYTRTFQGNHIDSAFYSHLWSIDNFWVRDIVCTEVATGKDVYDVPNIAPKSPNNFNYIYRSKDYFLKSKSKVDFFFEPDFKIDSVSVRAYVKKDSYANLDSIYTFKGDVFPKDVKVFVKKLRSFDVLPFYLYHDGKREDVSVVIIE